MKKILKVVAVVCLLLGVIFTVLNIVSVKGEGQLFTAPPGEGENGAWKLQPDGSWTCQGNPLDC